MIRIFTVPEDEDSTLARIEREISHNLVEFLRTNVVAGEVPPSELERDFLDTRIPEDPTFVSDHASFLLEKVVAQSVNVSSPGFVGHMTSALPYFMMPLAKIMVALNQNVVKIETSKAFTPLERQVLAMLHRLVFGGTDAFYQSMTQNHEEALGTFTSGGTAANLVAMWVARNILLRKKPGFPGIDQEGVVAGLRAYGFDGLAVLVSKRAHYSFKKVVDILGIGQRQLVLIRTDSNNRIDINHLTSEIAHLKESRIAPLAIVGIAGTTETGNVDPLYKIAEIARDNHSWFHVDAAWGGSTLFSQKHKTLLRGIEMADSVTLDAHKQLYVPIGAGMALFRDGQALKSIEQHAEYIIREGSRDLGKFTLEGSRPGIALLVHSGLHIIGRRGYELLIDQGIERARHFADLIRQSDDFELVTEPELNILTYRYVPPFVREYLDANSGVSNLLNELLNDFTATLQKTQRAAGKTFVSRTHIESSRFLHHGVTVLRCVLGNPLSTMEVLMGILVEQREIADKLLRDGYQRVFEKVLKEKGNWH